MNKMDLRELRNAFSTFITGVTVVTTRQADGTPRGFTANSFSSVSLDPPLLSVCIGKSADSLATFNRADGFAINILSEQQAEISGLFASKRKDKFEIAKWHNGPAGHPVLEEVCAWFDCKVEQRIDAGDHVMLIGRVQGFRHNDQGGLGFVRGSYTTMGLGQAAVTAAGHSSGVVVGAIVENNGKLLLRRNPDTGHWHPVASGMGKQQGSVARLKILLQGLERKIVITSLYAVFENEKTDNHFVYYRATTGELTESRGTLNRGDFQDNFFAYRDIPWDEVEGGAVTSMLQRYVAESRDRRFGIYFGSENAGTVQSNA